MDQSNNTKSGIWIKNSRGDKMGLSKKLKIERFFGPKFNIFVLSIDFLDSPMAPEEGFEPPA